jgi:hypothetical protein
MTTSISGHSNPPNPPSLLAVAAVGVDMVPMPLPFSATTQ